MSKSNISPTGDFVVESFSQKLQRKFSAEPLIPIGSILTVACLVSGIRAFKNGDTIKSQSMMRYRVLAQGFTIAVVMAGGMYGLKPHDRPRDMETKMARVAQNNEEQ